MNTFAPSIARQSSRATPVRRCGNENPNRYSRVIKRTPNPTDALKAALDAVEAFGASPSYKRAKVARRGVAHA